MCKQTVQASECSTLRMGSKPGTVIYKGTVMEYVGIGWIALRDATEADYDLYPCVVDGPDIPTTPRKENE